jgi:hypothetical protein
MYFLWGRKWISEYYLDDLNAPMHCNLNKGMYLVFTSLTTMMHHSSNQKDSFDDACHILSHNKYNISVWFTLRKAMQYKIVIQNSHSVVSAISSGKKQFNELFPSKYKRNLIQVFSESHGACSSHSNLLACNCILTKTKHEDSLIHRHL